MDVYLLFSFFPLYFQNMYTIRCQILRTRNVKYQTLHPCTHGCPMHAGDVTCDRKFPVNWQLGNSDRQTIYNIFATNYVRRCITRLPLYLLRPCALRTTSKTRTWPFWVSGRYGIRVGRLWLCWGSAVRCGTGSSGSHRDERPCSLWMRYVYYLLIPRIMRLKTVFVIFVCIDGGRATRAVG